MRRAWALGTVLAVALAACGGDTATTTTPATPPSTATVATTVVSTTSTTQPTTTTTAPLPSLDEQSDLTLHALGPVVFGMTVGEAEKVSGLAFEGELDPSISENCYYATAGDTMTGVSFMVFDDLIQRIEIEAPSPLHTRSGIGVGSTRDDLLETYPDNIQTTNEAVLDGEAMGFVPNDDDDADYRIFFELDEDGVITKIRAGIKPVVDFVEGCGAPADDETTTTTEG